MTNNGARLNVKYIGYRKKKELKQCAVCLKVLQQRSKTYLCHSCRVYEWGINLKEQYINKSCECRITHFKEKK